MNTGFSTFDNRYKKMKKTGLLDPKIQKDKIQVPKSTSTRIVNGKLSKLRNNENALGKLPRRNFGFGQKALKGK